jgi:hypothetical protein
MNEVHSGVVVGHSLFSWVEEGYGRVCHLYLLEPDGVVRKVLYRVSYNIYNPSPDGRSPLAMGATLREFWWGEGRCYWTYETHKDTHKILYGTGHWIDPRYLPNKEEN